MLQVVFENENFIVLNKPSGLIVNRSETTVNLKTLQDLLEDEGLVDIEKYDKESDYVKRTGIVHRLDKETSGLILVAKNIEYFEYLQSLFKERQVYKQYLSLVHGLLKPKEGKISMPVGRLPWKKSHFGAMPGGKESETDYEVQNYFERVEKKNKYYYSYLLLKPKSGRTHQIRVHLKYLGHPVVSDYMYAGRKTSRNDRKILDRVFLHAARLRFNDIGGEEFDFKSELPEELNIFLQSLNLVNNI